LVVAVTATVVPIEIEPNVRKILNYPPAPQSNVRVPAPFRSCSSYTTCRGCLTSSGCLWDPNTINGGSCKPSAQCDFTVALRVPAGGATSSPPPATACVSNPSLCGIHDFNGAPLNNNPNRGVGCTNSGQCTGSHQYCVDCTRCSGSQCNSNCWGPNPVSGYCAPSYLCQNNQDAIEGYCPSSVVTPVVTNCPYSDCYSCTSHSGCIWSGSYCYAGSSCSYPGCASSYLQCTGGSGGSSCTATDCASCAAGQGCVWSGSYCYDQTTPGCSQPGCANYPNQCYRG